VPLERRSTQTPLQDVRPDGHVHAPRLQICPLAQTTLHAPQWLGSDVESMHAPSHATRPAAHESAHAPLLHTVPAAQTLPHAPQFFGSLVTLTHASPHAR
jgi:hypothetical protein